MIVGTKSYARKHGEGTSLRRYEMELRGNAPNPVGEETTLAYTLSEKRAVNVEVYNILGQCVRTLVNETREAGLHRMKWEGKNRYGDPVWSSVYFYQLEAGNVTETRKMVLIR